MGGSKGRRYIYTCGWFTLLYGRNQHNIVKQFSSVQFSRSVVSDSLRSREPQHARPPCPSPSLGVHSHSRPSSRWCHPAISSSVVPFSSCPQSLPASESSPMSLKTLKSLLQHHSSKASILWHSALFIVQLSYPYMTTGKNYSFDQMDLYQQSNVSAF